VPPSDYNRLLTLALFYIVSWNRTRFSLSSHILAAALQSLATNHRTNFARNAAAGATALTVVNFSAFSLAGEWGQTTRRALT
jgi:hypothetical protein